MRVLWISAFVVLVDQLTKAAVLHYMYRQQSIDIVGDWLKLTFTENPGMAFGIMVGPRGMVTVFSVVATLLVVWYIYKVRRGYMPYLASLALISGGAIGNVIDRVFYGVLQGTAPLFMGKVVDFIHVSLWSGYMPNWLPVIGGSWISLFPIWNVADMAIVAGVVGILLFQKKFHQQFLSTMGGEEEARAGEEAGRPAVAESARNGQARVPAARTPVVESPEGGRGSREETS